MNIRIFWTAYLFLQSFIVAQIFAANNDSGGWLTQSQLNRWNGGRGYPLTVHLGIMIVDIFFMSATIAHLMSKYHEKYIGIWSILVVALITVGILWLANKQKAIAVGWGGEAHSHDGKTTIAGNLHIIYAVLCAWVIIYTVFYWLTSRSISRHDMCLLTWTLTVLCLFGAVKAHPHWFIWERLKRDDVFWWQSIAGTIAVWAIFWGRVVFGNIQK